MQNFNLHTHSIYSDGKSQPREIVEEAVRQGLMTLGFSEHSPLPFDNNFSVKEVDMPRYVAAIAQLKAEFKDKIDIYCGLEADYLTGVSEPFAVTKEKYHLDYLIGGVHLVINPVFRQAQRPKDPEPVEGPTNTINLTSSPTSTKSRCTTENAISTRTSLGTENLPSKPSTSSARKVL